MSALPGTGVTHGLVGRVGARALGGERGGALVERHGRALLPHLLACAAASRLAKQVLGTVAVCLDF